MAIDSKDGFDSGATVTELGYTGSGGSTITTGGRFGGGVLDSGPGNVNRTKALRDGTRTKVGQHVAISMSSYTPFQSLAFYEGAITHVYLKFTALGKIEVYRGGGVLLGTGTAIVAPPGIGNWTGIEIYVEISDTVGVVKVWVNGVLDINLSSQDTKNGGSGVIDSVGFVTAYGGSDRAYFDDWVVYNDAATATTAPIGDVRVESLLPNGDGNYSQLAGSDGNSVNNSLLVDETTPNGDTDYVESSTVGDKDTYALANLAVTSGTVLAVGARLYARKTDAGTRQVSALYRLSATDMDGATKTLASTYASIEDTPQETKPGGGSWSIANVDSLEAGMKIVA